MTLDEYKKQIIEHDKRIREINDRANAVVQAAEVEAQRIREEAHPIELEKDALADAASEEYSPVKVGTMKNHDGWRKYKWRVECVFLRLMWRGKNDEIPIFHWEVRGNQLTKSGEPHKGKRSEYECIKA